MKRELSKIGDLATYVNGYAFKPSDWSLKGRPIIRIQDLTGNDYQTNYYEGTLDERYKIKKGDLLISWSASIGVYEWEKEDAWLNQHIFKVVFDKDVAIDKKYFRYAVDNALQKVSGLVHGSTMKHLTKGVFDAIQVPLYSIGNQKEIVQRLESIQRSINIVEQTRLKLDTLVKSRFIEMFGDLESNTKGWKKVTFDEVSEKITDGEHATVPRVDKGYVFLNARNVLKSGEIDLTGVTFISEENHNRIYKRCNPEPGDILLTTTGTIGNVAIVPKIDAFSMDRGITLIKQDRSVINGTFFAVAMQMDSLQMHMKNGIHASAIGHLFMNKVKALPIVVPPIDLQNQFADFVEQVDKSKSVLQKLLEKQELLRAALMQEYFG